MFKRIFDVVASVFGLLLLLPVFILISIWILLDSKGPVFFLQERVGLNGRVFRIHKFRTMYVNSEELSRITIGADRRVTNCGRFLRKSKLDEIPQLIDVLFGAMSLVGPRPEVPEYMNQYDQSTRDLVLSVRPGITDNASLEMIDENEILARYSDPANAYVEVVLPIKQKHYVRYVRDHSFCGDLIIIMKTIKRIVKR